MAKIHTVAGLISEALKLDPIEVQGHVEGLRAAERLESDDMGPVEVADLLCACLNLDVKHATGAFHLPFIGAVIGEPDFQWIAGSDEPALRRLNFPFGGIVAELLYELSARELWGPEVIVSISTHWHGGQQLASVHLDGCAFYLPGGYARLLFGHELLGSAVGLLTKQASLVTTRTIGRDIMADLASYLRGAPAALSIAPAAPADLARAH